MLMEASIVSISQVRQRAVRGHFFEVDNMKRLVVMLVLTVLTWVPEQTYSQSQEPVGAASQLDATIAELVKARDAIADVKENLRAIPSDTECGAVALTSLDTAYWIYECVLAELVWHDCAKAECKPLWRPTITRQLSVAKTHLSEDTINRLYKAFMKEKTTAISTKIVIARDIIRSSLPLFDTAIQIIEMKQEDQ